jgi:hypothetical protein
MYRCIPCATGRRRCRTPRLVDAVDVGPLLHELGQVGRTHDEVGVAVPDRHRRPGTGPRRRGAHLVAPLRRRQVGAGVHAGIRRTLARRAAIGQARQDRAAGEQFGVGREHHGGHGAARGQPGHVDACRRASVIGGHASDHLPDRQRFALVARDVAGNEPVETVARVVRALLLRQQQREMPAVGEHLPAGLGIVARRRLRTAVHRDDERRVGRQACRHVLEHAQVAGIRAESGHLGLRRQRRRCSEQAAQQPAARARRRGAGTKRNRHGRILRGGNRACAVSHSAATPHTVRRGKLRCTIGRRARANDSKTPSRFPFRRRREANGAIRHAAMRSAEASLRTRRESRRFSATSVFAGLVRSTGTICAREAKPWPGSDASPRYHEIPVVLAAQK